MSMIGNTLGHYQITSQLGKGGMGEVYQAKDQKLGRDIAIKVLPEEFAKNADRVARFQREAKLLASLNHPSIAAIYGLEESGGTNFLVLELVEGETLADQIKRGPITVEDSLKLALQIAEALEAAHEKGVVHRDLKPANIKVTPDGKVKVLDFGLAKAFAGEQVEMNLSNSPTLSNAATQQGLILGTAAYMSPEQARGEAVDKKADIWAFGVVLFEMLTGRGMFEGRTVSDTLAAVLMREPEWKRLPLNLHPRIRLLLERCLEKESRNRYGSISDARVDIQNALSDPSGVFVQPVTSLEPRMKLRMMLPWTVTAILAVVLAIALWTLWPAKRSSEQPLVRLDVDLGPDVSLGPTYGTDAIISPDGNRLVFVWKSRLFTRRLDQPKATELAGTEGADEPFFSPDSQWVAFFANNKLKKISVEGGASIALCDMKTTPAGGSWGEDGNIIAALTYMGPLSRIPSAGGAPTPVTELAQGEATHRWPQILPGGKAVLFTAHTSTGGFDRANIEVMSFKDHRRKTLQRGGTYSRYLPSGHLVYINKGTLFAVPFDLDKLEVRGTPSPVLEEVASSTRYGSAQFDFSQGGTLVYRSGGAAGGLVTLQWLDGTGKTQPLPAKPGLFTRPHLSPDGKLLALAVTSESGSDIWTYDWQRDAMTRLTFGGGSFSFPVWSPDGRYVAFQGDAGDMFWTRADGAGNPQPLTQSKKQQFPWSFSPDGRRLAFAEGNPRGPMDLWTVPVENQGSQLRAGKPEIFLQSSANAVFPAFSPDGRWIAYMSNDSGTMEIYVRAFPDRGGKWLVSNNGGVLAVWSRNGRELFYRTADQRIMVVTYTAKGDSFVVDKPHLWTEKRLADTSTIQNLDITPDGKRFVVLLPAEGMEEQKPQNHVTFLQNFFDELRRRVPVK